MSLIILKSLENGLHRHKRANLEQPNNVHIAWVLLYFLGSTATVSVGYWCKIVPYNNRNATLFVYAQEINP